MALAAGEVLSAKTNTARISAGCQRERGDGRAALDLLLQPQRSRAGPAGGSLAPFRKLQNGDTFPRARFGHFVELNVIFFSPVPYANAIPGVSAEEVCASSCSVGKDARKKDVRTAGGSTGRFPELLERFYSVETSCCSSWCWLVVLHVSVLHAGHAVMASHKL